MYVHASHSFNDTYRKEHYGLQMLILTFILFATPPADQDSRCYGRQDRCFSLVGGKRKVHLPRLALSSDTLSPRIFILVVYE